jgi:hypothetical protein
LISSAWATILWLAWSRFSAATFGRFSDVFFFLTPLAVYAVIVLVVCILHVYAPVYLAWRPTTNQITSLLISLALAAPIGLWLCATHLRLNREPMQAAAPVKFSKLRGVADIPAFRSKPRVLLMSPWLSIVRDGSQAIELVKVFFSGFFIVGIFAWLGRDMHLPEGLSSIIPTGICSLMASQVAWRYIAFLPSPELVDVSPITSRALMSWRVASLSMPLIVLDFVMRSTLLFSMHSVGQLLNAGVDVVLIFAVIILNVSMRKHFASSRHKPTLLAFCELALTAGVAFVAGR